MLQSIKTAQVFVKIESFTPQSVIHSPLNNKPERQVGKCSQERIWTRNIITTDHWVIFRKEQCPLILKKLKKEFFIFIIFCD